MILHALLFIFLRTFKRPIFYKAPKNFPKQLNWSRPPGRVKTFIDKLVKQVVYSRLLATDVKDAGTMAEQVHEGVCSFSKLFSKNARRICVLYADGYCNRVSACKTQVCVIRRPSTKHFTSRDLMQTFSAPLCSFFDLKTKFRCNFYQLTLATI